MSYSQKSHTEKTWILRHPVFVLFCVNIFILLLAEGALRFLAYTGSITIVPYATTDASQRLMGDINEHFGVWRYPNRSVRVSAPCFDVENTSNSFGARDKERELQSGAEKRFIVLGDSFAEGFGVAQEKRFSDVLEQKTGIEVLNFGISGNFGSIQEWMLYEHLAMQFDHSHVIVFVLPSNDFDDNEPENFEKDRYRPYLRSTQGDSYEVYYPVSFEKRKQAKGMSASRAFRRELYNKIYLLNIIRQFGDAWEKSEMKDSIDEIEAQSSQSRYVEYSEEDAKRVFFSLEKIIQLARDRKVSLVMIPRPVDFAAFEDAGRKTLPFVKDMLTFAEASPQVEVIDLLPHFLRHAEQNGHEQEDYFLQCDGHWSELGHQTVAEILQVGGSASLQAR